MKRKPGLIGVLYAAILAAIAGYFFRTAQLSGGMAQRVALVRTLINEPEILLLDEPLGALDLKLRKEMQLELKRLQREMNITFVYVTHDQEEALTMSDTVVVMSGGKIQQIGSPQDIYNEPKNAFVARFIGHYNVYDPAQAKTLLNLPAESGCKVVAIRPEAFTLEGGEGKIHLNGKVVRSSMLGSVTRYQIDCGAIPVNLELLNHDTRHLNIGETVDFYINNKNVLHIHE